MLTATLTPTLAPSLAPRRGFIALVQRHEGATHATTDGMWTLCNLRLLPAAVERGEWRLARLTHAVQCQMCRREWEGKGR